MSYRLLNYQPPNISKLQQSYVDRCCALSTIGFFSHMMSGFQRQPIVDQQLLAQVKDLTILTWSSWECHQTVLLWVLFMVGSVVSTAPEASWFVLQASKIVQPAGIQTWQDVTDNLSQILWNQRCEGPCRAFWWDILRLRFG